jgi:hypothetical protein
MTCFLHKSLLWCLIHRIKPLVKIYRSKHSLVSLLLFIFFIIIFFFKEEKKKEEAFNYSFF